MSEKQSIKILLIEDDEDDVYQIRTMLSEAKNYSFELSHVDKLSSALSYLKTNTPEVIISDLGLPDSWKIDTLIKVHSDSPEVPVIVLTGLGEEENAIAALRNGAQDYLVKGSFNSELLVRSILYSIERNKLLMQLENSLKEIRQLKGLIPICAWCRKIRDDDGFWKQVESYITNHSDAKITHGMCPDCEKNARIELEKMKNA
jgi:DNA-binding response OmpR family regulator